jgi:4'-phosphopantetheinyl transferase EntD
VLESLLPEGVAVEEIVGDDPTAALLPEEREIVARAVEKRRREVTYARTCARRALRALGLPEVAIPRGDKGQPLWPDGVVGSLTHTNGYYAAAVAAGTVRSIGIDAEQHDRLPDGVLDHVAFGPEPRMVAALGVGSGPGVDGVWWDRVLFSAKESVYKAWFPLTHRWLGFEDAELTIDPGAGTFRARVLVDGATSDGPPLTTLSGRFLVRDGLILTAIALPPTSA